MLETIKTPSIHHNNHHKKINRYSPYTNHRIANHKIVNLAFQQNQEQQQNIFRYSPNINKLDMGFKTFYQNSYRKKHKPQLRYTSLSTRDAVLSQRHSVVGTNFASLEIKQFSDSATPTLPLMDRQRYKYLLKAIPGLNKGYKLIDFKQYKVPKLNPEQLFSTVPLNIQESLVQNFRGNYHKTLMNKKKDNRKSPCQSNQLEEDSLSPKVVNISSEFNSSMTLTQQRNSKGSFRQNPFQKTFKGKQILQSKYRSKQLHQQPLFQVSLVSDDQLIINKISVGGIFKQNKNKN